MVARVDSAGDEGGGFGVGTGNGEEVGAWRRIGLDYLRTNVGIRHWLTHDISLSADGNETVDVFADRNQDLASHVSTLLGTRRLILNVNTSSTLLDKELGELHDSCQTTVTGVCICNERSQEVDVWCLRLVGRAETLFALLAVVEELGHEQVADLVGDGGVRVVCKIGTRLVGGGSG